MAGHHSVNKLLNQFRQYWYWPESYTLIADYVRNGRDCQMLKR